CQCNSTLKKFNDFFKLLHNLKIIELVITEPMIELIFEKIDNHLELQCKSSYDKSYIKDIYKWIEKLIISWPDEILFKSLEKNESSIRFLSNYAKKFKYYAANIYGKMRIDQLFDIIIEYPDSLPVLMDLIECLKLVPELKMILVYSLKQALKLRLLHPGVNTGDILTAYISTMRALRILDQSGVLLEMVGEPVKQYLKGRDDTVRCIVTSLTEDSNNDLSEELNKGYLLADSDSEDELSCLFNWETWNPDPVEAEPLRPSQASRSFDIISMLVNIYGSKELFIEEYRSLLADRILTQLSYDTVKEIKHLELLKLRFGESQLHQCEIMLKDVSDSRRISNIIQSRKQSVDASDVIPINGMILSAQFWPPRLKDEKVKLPDCLINSMQHYKKSFELLKGNRTLIWKPHLGLVNMEIELKGKILTFNVSPIHAAIIWHFQSKPVYTVDELSSIMQMPTQALQRKIAFWQSQGLLKEDGVDTFRVVDELKSTSQDTMIVDEDTVESVLVSSKDQKEEELQIIWSYIVGMLTNLESLSLERIHAMLKMFAMQGPGSQCSLSDLKAILELKLKELKLVYSNGVYRLPPS
ncbi:hypothetical protein HELRODRAFT_73864, partial [Helobdella robusta]|uniref:Anaphase-promoting complex subunit 2 n=1 Tax=Helobdella robusta TaxID=6412 RepID=T1G1J6_HELRO